MKQVSKSDIEQNPDFMFAKGFLKNQVLTIAKTFECSEDSDKELRANNHYTMVATIVKMYMTVLESFTESDLKDLSNKNKNIQSLNRFLALRQLAETQLHGVLQGTWGILSTVTSTPEFRDAIAKSKDTITRAVIWNSVNN